MNKRDLLCHYRLSSGCSVEDLYDLYLFNMENIQTNSLTWEDISFKNVQSKKPKRNVNSVFYNALQT